MTRATRLAASITLSLAGLMPLTALAITPDFVGGKDPVVETPGDPDPVVETPDPVPNGQEIKRRGEDGLTKEKRDPVKQPPKRVVTVPSGQPTKVYPVPSRANFCPNGLQPVTISGEISCGAPNQAMTYPQMLAHPQPKRAKRKARTVYHRSAHPTCAVGTKGCSDR